MVYSLPFAVQPISAAFARIDPSLLEASASLGASPLADVRAHHAAARDGGILAGAVLSFAHTLGEFGVVLMVGGNLPGVTRTVSISIYDQVQAFEYRPRTTTALLLLVFSFLVLAAVYALQRRPWSAL